MTRLFQKNGCVSAFSLMLILVLSLFIVLYFYIKPSPPNIRNMNINKAIIMMERNDYFTLYYGNASEQAYTNYKDRNILSERIYYKKDKILYCDDDTKVSFGLYTADAWIIDTDLNEDCIVLEYEVRWKGLTL